MTCAGRRPGTVQREPLRGAVGLDRKITGGFPVEEASEPGYEERIDVAWAQRGKTGVSEVLGAGAIRTEMKPVWLRMRESKSETVPER